MDFLVGIDEAGRGPLAGPVTAGCVLLPSDFPVEILNDSKKLSETPGWSCSFSSSCPRLPATRRGRLW